MKRTSDFKLGDLVWVGDAGYVEDRNHMAVVIPQPARFVRLYSSNDYVWVRFLHSGRDNGISPFYVTKAEEQTDDAAGDR